MSNENNNNQVDFIFEDISSNSENTVEKIKETAKKVTKPVIKYADGIFKYLGQLIKIIGFLIGFGIFAMCLFVGYYLYSKDPSFKLISLGIIIAGIVIGMIVMFLIFGSGHIICQNNEILRRLDRLENGEND